MIQKRPLFIGIILLLLVHHLNLHAGNMDGVKKVPAESKGTIRGMVVDASTGEGLIGANVLLTGTTIGTITDFDGNFSLEDIDPGVVSISASYVSYETQVFESVDVQAGEVVILNANLNLSTQAIEEVVITARQREVTEAALQVKQMKAASVLDGISSQQISRLGDSDAASALKRVTGVSVEGGKYVYVRGLSDRYMTVVMNGARIPGLDPNRNTVQMDLFPSNIIESMVVHKTYRADLPSYSGGFVNVVTKDFPEKLTVSASASLGYNPQVHFNDQFLYYEGSKTDWLGYDNGKRDIPESIKYYAFPGLSLRQIDTVHAISSAFSKQLSPVRESKFLDQSYSLSVGNQVNVFGKQLGIIAAISYDKKYAYYSGGKTGNYDAISENTLSAFDRHNEDYGQEEVIWSGLVGMSYKINNNHNVGITYLRNQNGISGARYKNGVQFYDGPGETEEVRILEYLQRSVNAIQGRGKHVISGLNHGYLEWQSSYTHSILKEPDLRTFINRIQYDSTTVPPTSSYYLYTNRDPRRRYRDMWETNWDNSLDFTIPFDLSEGKSKIMTGGSYLQKFRDSREREYVIQARGSVPFEGVPEDYVADENLVSPESPYRGTYYFYDQLTEQSYSYIGQEAILGAYVLADLSITPRFRAMVGLRFEQDDALIHNLVDTLGVSDVQRRTAVDAYAEGSSLDNDFLPTVNLTYQLIERMNFRLAYSRTVARPAFRERAPYSYYDYDWGARVQGNPELISSTIDNLDIRWEYFFGRGEMISVSGFYKYLRDPIEKFRVQKTVSRIEYRNHTDGYLYGAEIELRKNLGFINALRDFNFGANVTLIKSQTDVDSLRYAKAIETDPDFPKTRPMFGQSPYLVNVYLGYANNDLGLYSNLIFNVQGEKIVLISKFSTPDVCEQPFPKLDFNISKRLGKYIDLKFKVENILNSYFEQTYTLNDVEKPFVAHYFGRKFSLGIAFNIK